MTRTIKKANITVVSLEGEKSISGLLLKNEKEIKKYCSKNNYILKDYYLYEGRYFMPIESFVQYAEEIKGEE